ncbi:sigma-70 family RNA polymerase sigma factor [Paramagnetospirillum kuznetsovii]|uniref:sigma-70 family RNA polymerase sigma factor n=1 Tax=Paramagnetospirillum kuznetsovii TaxID=2053833 RepID=UPI001EFD0DB1|nr:sigma-70 family RNA polymerase sigma factor [Paramagnetospirillum kuznetsovii]
MESQIEELIPALRRYARALTGNISVADDLVQDCLERSLSRLALWRRGSDLRAWLFTIMRNIRVNDLTRQRTRPDMTASDEDLDRQSAAPTQGDRMVVRDLASALEQLVPEQREVVLLVGLEGMSYAEVAEVTGVPLGTVMSRLKRGRDRLSHLMNGSEPAIRRVK